MRSSPLSHSLYSLLPQRSPNRSLGRLNRFSTARMALDVVEPSASVLQAFVRDLSLSGQSARPHSPSAQAPCVAGRSRMIVLLFS